jgi:hypothetical protein
MRLVSKKTLDTHSSFLLGLNASSTHNVASTANYVIFHLLKVFALEYQGLNRN